jgi:hypothetical protein
MTNDRFRGIIFEGTRGGVDPPSWGDKGLLCACLIVGRSALETGAPRARFGMVVHQRESAKSVARRRAGAGESQTRRMTSRIEAVATPITLSAAP